MAELHVLGEIFGAYKFTARTLFCRFSFQTGPNWAIISGSAEGQTSSDCSAYEGPVVWAHPIDIHFASKGVQGWPKLLVQVHCLDSVGRCWIVGYSSCVLPTTPGPHVLDLPCWVPAATSIVDTVRQYFLGGSNTLIHPDLTASGSDRYNLKTNSTGHIVVNLDMVFRNFDRFGVEYK